MKIHILPTDSQLQPTSQPFNYPKHNRDYGVEQDFLVFLKKNAQLTVDQPEQADWHYLPVFWTRWHLNHDYAQTGLDELESLVKSCVRNDKKTFTICQYDDGPVVNLGQVKIFYAARKNNHGDDIPLLSAPHKKPILRPAKKYLASFIGRLETHVIRQQMADRYQSQAGYLIQDEEVSSRSYINKMLKSYVVLCPRGYGGNSFRFYEAMQLGVVPFLIGDYDTRPFKKSIEWDQISFYSKSVEEVASIIANKTKAELIRMGSQAKKIYDSKLAFGCWPTLLIEGLEKS